MKIYTKTGDDGTTGLFGGGRVPKNAPRIRAYGTLDELNSTLGIVRAHGVDDAIAPMLTAIQSELFSIGGELATVNPEKHGTRWETADAVAQMESWIDLLDAKLEPMRCFILPGGGIIAAQLHLSRTVCRRAERDVLDFANHEESDAGLENISHILIYLNRLSDLLFVMSRYANHIEGIADVPWISTRKKP